MRRALVALLVVAILLAPGCARPSTPASREADATLRAWRAEAEAHRPFGVNATLDVQARDWIAEGRGRNATPFDPVVLLVASVFPSDKPLVFFRNATVNGQRGAWLVVEADRPRLYHARVWTGPIREMAMHDRNVTVALVQPIGHQTQPDFRGWEDANRSFFFTREGLVSIQNGTLSNYTRAVLYQTDGTAQEIGGPSLTLDADAIAWDDASRLQSIAWRAPFEHVSMAGNATAGGLGRPMELTKPTLVVGDDVFVTMFDWQVTTGAFRLTLAADENGALVTRASVEISAPEAKDVRVAQGNETWVRLVYRERSFTSDAVLQNVTVTGPGASMITVPLAAPPDLIAQLFDAVGRAGPFAAFAAIPFAVAAPFVAFLEGIACAIGGCPEQEPFPTWMGAGEAREAFFKVNATAPAGSYDATITLVGENYDPVRVPVHVVVT